MIIEDLHTPIHPCSKNKVYIFIYLDISISSYIDDDNTIKFALCNTCNSFRSDFTKNVIQLCHCHVQVYKQDRCINGKHIIYWWGLQTGEKRALVRLSIRFVPSHINSISTVNTASKFAKMLFNLIIKTRGSQEPVIAHLDQSWFQ